jgi:cysteine desulfurase
MVLVLRDAWGNASSIHHFGQQAKAAVDEARGAVATLIGADAPEIVFTAGGTESDNIAIRGAAEALEPSGRMHLVTSAIEHEAVLTTMKSLARRGWRVTTIPVDASGVVSVDRLREAMRTTRLGRCSRSPSLLPPRTRTARCSTPTRCSRPASCRSTCAPSVSTC